MHHDWPSWSAEFFGEPYEVWHDGAHFTGLDARVRTAPAEVAEMLAAGVRARDPLAAQGLGHLASVGLAPAGAADLLRSAVDGASGRFLIRAGEALFALTGDPSWADSLLAVLASEESPYVRLDAAIGLAGFPPAPGTVAALTRALHDEEYLIRYHAANTLLRYAGSDIDRDGATFALIAVPAEGEPSAADRASWQRAAHELTARLA